MRLNSINFNTILRQGAKKLPALGVLFFALGLSSCDNVVYDDDPNCPGVALRFVYNHHMEPTVGADGNAFPGNVDCVNVLVFDTLGNYVTQFAETSTVLRDENYRMELPLDTGYYHLVVYGGTACENSTFELNATEWTSTRAAGNTKDDIRVTLPLNEQGYSNKQLHDIEARTGGLFYGTYDLHLTQEDLDTPELQVHTVYLVKNTNNIQIILQELSNPYKIDYADYNFKIVDDNFVLDGYNKTISVATDDFQPYYSPYAAENRIMGYVDVEGKNNGEPVEIDSTRIVQVACAEFSTSRLLIEHIATARLVVTSTKEKDKNGNDKEIINIPLITYLSAIRGFGDSWIKSDQEFLDRQSRWTMMFFLLKNVWVSARVCINDWTVRVNDIEL